MFAVQDYILNGVGHGPVAAGLECINFDTNLRRPYKDDNGRPCCDVRTGRMTFNKELGASLPEYERVLIKDLRDAGIDSPVFNAATLRKEEWIMLDAVVLRAARYRLRAWADLAAANSYGGFNGMAKMILEHETMSDPGDAVVDMDALTEGRSDQPLWQLQGLPLPITHSDFWFSARRLAISRNTGTPLDTTMGEAAGRRIAERIEKTTIGVSTGVTYGGASTYVGGYGRNSTVYGYINFPNRLTRTINYKPTGNGRSGTGWTPADTLKDVLAMRDLLYLNKFYGPFMIYHTNDWDQYMDNDYILTGGNVATQTLRERLKSIDDITDVRRLDFFFSTVPGPNAAGSGAPLSSGGFVQPGSQVDVSLSPFRLLMVQMTPDVARAVNGMDITTVQWESVGGMRLNFKVLCIQVPQLRADFYGNCGLLDATATL
jgi:hypothetical protein